MKRLAILTCLSTLAWAAGGWAAEAEYTVREGGLLKCESLPHAAVSMVGPKATHVVPRADGGSTALLFCPREKDGKTYNVLVYANLNTGETRQEDVPTGIGHPWSQVWGPDGRLYFGLWGPATLTRYDPATDKLDTFGTIEPDDKETPHLTVGTDEKIYGLCGPGGHVFSFDPATGETVRYGLLNPPREYDIAYDGSIGVDDKYIYATFGNVPAERWTYEMNKETRELTKLDGLQGARFTQGRLGVTAIVGDRNAAQTYWMVDGKPVLQKSKDEAAPWPVRELAERKPAPTSADKVEWYQNATDVKRDGTVTLWYRLGKQAPWRTVTYQVPPEELQFSRCGVLPDGRLFSTVIGYDTMCVYDPKMDVFEQPGRLPSSNRSFIVVDNLVYLAGYSGANLFMWDPATPWTIEKGTPDQPAPAVTSLESNPRQLPAWARQGNFQFPLNVVRAADGALYASLHGERHNVGSTLSWREPTPAGDAKTPPFSANEGFLREPFGLYDVAGMCTALDGTKIAYSTCAVKGVAGEPRPENGRLFLFDVGSRAVEWYIEPLPGIDSTGFVQEYAPGKLILVAADVKNWDYDRWKGEFQKSVLYTVDIATHKVERRVDLKGQLGNRREYFWLTAFQKGPDGMIYTYYGDMLVKIDPQTLKITALSQVGKPGFIAFIGRDAYLSGENRLRRVRGL